MKFRNRNRVVIRDDVELCELNLRNEAGELLTDENIYEYIELLKSQFEKLPEWAESVRRLEGDDSSALG